MCPIERETQNFILKFREILRRETVIRAYGMKSDEKLFSMRLFEGKWYML